MNNSQRSGLLRCIAEKIEPSDQVRDSMLYFLRGFSICAENRNIALHSDGHLGETHFHFLGAVTRLVTFAE